MRIILLTVWVTALIIANLFMFGLVFVLQKIRKIQHQTRVSDL